jgi:hypothetical protein
MSIFNAVVLLLIVLPWTTVSALQSDAKGGWRTCFLFATVVGTGLLSATRSIIIVAVFAGCLYLILKRKRFGANFLLRLTVGLGIVPLVLMWLLPLVGTFVIDRFRNTQLGEEARAGEISLWWPQINNDLVAGQGMGSRFVSNVVVNGSPLASAPHIGIVTFLMKGGVPLFLAYAVVPLILAVRILFSPSLPKEQRGAAASVLAFIGLACLSGGWFPLHMFAYGLAIASMMPERRERSSSRRRLARWTPVLRPDLPQMSCNDEGFARN